MIQKSRQETVGRREEKVHVFSVIIDDGYGGASYVGR